MCIKCLWSEFFQESRSYRIFIVKHASIVASEYLNSKEVSTTYFLICWGLFISKITIAISRSGFFFFLGGGGFLVLKLKFTIKDPQRSRFGRVCPPIFWHAALPALNLRQAHTCPLEIIVYTKECWISHVTDIVIWVWL